MCECSDKGCKEHKGKTTCENVGDIVLYRIDMQDETGTLFCSGCADDAMISGLFSEDNPSGDGWTICPICDGYGIPIGPLGQRMYYRCESCGMDFSEV